MPKVVHGSGRHLNAQHDGTVFQTTFGQSVSLSPRFDPGFLHGIKLREPVEVLLLSPASAEVVVLKLARFHVADHRVSPARQIDGQARCFGAEESDGAVDRWRDFQALTRGGQGDRIPDFRLNLNDV